MPDWDPEANDVFLRAVEISAPEDRQRFLEAACAQNPDLRARVDRLLRAGAEAGSFLERPLGAQKLTAAHVASTADDTAVPHVSPGTTIGRYKLLEVIGEGGMGTVWLAEQTEPVRRKVALKVVKAGMDSKQVLARFEAERQALALMDHPNIAKVLDGGATADGHPYFVMELVKGVPITKYCDDHRMPPRRRLELFVQVCQAVQHAHQKGVIHRDIKPSNVLVAPYDGRPVPKVIDFGIAKATGQPLTEKTLFTGLGAVVGTPEYMSPEQAELNNQDIDTRSDIYSLGVLLYELLTGSTPLTRKRLKEAALLEMLRLVREEEAQKPSTRLSGTDELPSVAANRGLEPRHLTGLVRGELDWVILKSLEKDRTRRYETANGFAADLQRYLADEPVQAWPPSTLYRFRKFARRNKVLLTTATLIAVTVLAAGATATWNWWEAESARERERIAKDRAIQGEAKALAAERDAVREKVRADEQLGRAELLVYASKLSLAQSAFEEDKGDVALQYLEECQESLRGWEHRHLWSRYNARQTLRGHTRGLNGVAYSPDGRCIVTSSSDNTAKVWDAGTGREILTLAGHANVVYRVAYSPDGKHIVTGSWDNTAKVWDATTGRLLFTLAGHTNLICGVAYSPDGKRIVTASGPGITRNTITGMTVSTPQQGEAKVWDAGTGAEVFTFASHAWGVLGVAYSPDGGRIVTGSEYMAKVWDAGTGREIMALGGAVGPVAYSPDGRRILTGGRIAKLWDAATGREIFSLVWQTRYAFEHKEVQSVAFSPDGRHLVTGSSDKAVKVWDAESGRKVFSLNGHAGAVMGVAYSPDGRRIVTGSGAGNRGSWAGNWDYAGRVWDAETGQEPITFGEAANTMPTATFSPDSKRFVTYNGHDSPAKVRDAATGQELLTLYGRLQGGGGVAYSPDGRRIVTVKNANLDKDVRVEALVFDSHTGEQILSLESHAGGCGGGVAYSPDGRRIVTGSRDNTARVWDAETGRVIFTLEGHATTFISGVAHKSPILGVAYSPDGTRIATVTGGPDRTAMVWDAGTGRPLLSVKGHAKNMNSVAFSPDSKRIVTGSTDTTATVWDAETGREIFSLRGHTNAVEVVAFSPDGTRIATAGWDMTVRLWDAVTGQALLTLSGHDRYVGCIAFSPDGGRLLTGDWGNQFKLWDTGNASKELQNVYPLPDAAERRRYHTQQADRAEKEKKWFAVAFHVGRLLLDAPQDVDLTHRLREALQGRGVLDPDEMRRRGDLAGALTWARKGQAAAPEDAEANNYLAWMLAIYPDPKTRDAKRAITLARKAIGDRPPSWQHSRTLGLALHFAGDDSEAVKALNKSVELRSWGGDAFDYFLLAAAHQRLGNKAEARKWYDRGVIWARDNKHPYVAELAVVRADAEAALGIGKQPEPVPNIPPADKEKR